MDAEKSISLLNYTKKYKKETRTGLNQLSKHLMTYISECTGDIKHVFKIAKQPKNNVNQLLINSHV